MAVNVPAAGRQRAVLPGDPGMWVFVLGDLVIFAAYFVIFMVYRYQQPALFLDAQHHLNRDAAVVNTLLLLASSWSVATAVQAVRGGHTAAAARFLYGAGLGGVLFILIKAVEWWSEIAHHRTLSTNAFFMFYYMLTGVHLLHVALGLIILGVVRRELRAPPARAVRAIETAAVYWHMVDLLWIVIFAIVYIMR